MPTNETINVFDLSKDKAIGIDLPLFDDYGSRFKLNYITLDQASANARNLILTTQGERVMLPTFGCNLYKILFDNITDEVIDRAKLLIKQQFEYWLPYIFINNLEMEPGDEYNKNTLRVYLLISLKNNTLDTKSILLEITNNQ